SGLEASGEEEIRQRYVSRLNNLSSSWPAGSVNASCPHPVMTTQRHHDELSNLHVALKLALESIIERWWTDEEAQFPRRMPLMPEEEELLQWIDSNPELVRPWNEHQGSWRPDFLIEIDETGMEGFRICEINARFCWNGYMFCGFGQESLSIFNLESRGLVHATESELIIDGVMNIFDPKFPLYLVKGQEHGIDIFMFIELAKRQLGITPRLIAPEALRLIPDPSEKMGHKLCCLTESGAIDTITTESGEKIEEVYQLCLELHQSELNELDPEMRRHISMRCFNDMRSCLLVHDKRMLGIVREELGSLVSQNIISPEQARCLDRGIVPTILPGSTALDQLLQNCKLSEGLQTKYLLKPIRSGKGTGILFGDQISHSDWIAILESMRDPNFQLGKTLYVIQRNIDQPYYDVPLGSKAETERCHMVGTYHAVNGKYLGMGIWRCSPGRICAVSGGATWLCSVKKKAEV
ncbi:uncharacterized protein N7483_002625, partial [Penicillium malachiteum]|uniref:uncharacterized protein n=1 Tax=Penicillium malachiteum TaxID=1324776 RepID=UPI002547BCED